ncbi:MAG TPA: mismatch repair protein, partial [Terriglobales bacterium]
MLPSEEYVQRRNARQLRVSQYEQIHIRLGNARLLLAAVAVVMAWASFRAHDFSPWWLAAPVAAFVGLASYHTRILRARELAQRAAEFYEKGLARVEDRWANSGETGQRFDNPHHVYAADLDLFGNSSLFQLLSTARTRMGEDTLAEWLLSPAPVERVHERHAAVNELRDQLDLREDLAVLGEDVGVGVHPAVLSQWAESS